MTSAGSMEHWERIVKQTILAHRLKIIHSSKCICFQRQICWERL